MIICLLFPTGLSSKRIYTLYQSINILKIVSRARASIGVHLNWCGCFFVNLCLLVAAAATTAVVVASFYIWCDCAFVRRPKMCSGLVGGRARARAKEYIGYYGLMYTPASTLLRMKWKWWKKKFFFSAFGDAVWELRASAIVVELTECKERSYIYKFLKFDKYLSVCVRGARVVCDWANLIICIFFNWCDDLFGVFFYWKYIYFGTPLASLNQWWQMLGSFTLRSSS